MDLKNKTRAELEDKIKKLENFIETRGVGSQKLERAKRVQRDLNLAIILGGVTIALGVTAWSLYKYKGE
jgi:hypothetical protein